MKKDAEVQLFMQQRSKGKTQVQAANRAGLSERTARKYEKVAKLPSQLKQPRQYRTRTNPFEQDWDWVVEQLQADPALQATTLFTLLSQKFPGRYLPAQVRTLQRHISNWRTLNGPEKEVFFPQVHHPGEKAQSDFTHMTSLGITLKGEPFSHLLFHFVLTYSNVEAVTVCFSETFEALAEGIEHALWQIGGVPQQHRTDHLSAAIRRLDAKGREDFTQNYQALMAHYGMQPTWNNVGEAHENGDVEQSHYRFKEALDQALRVRGARDFTDRVSYERFIQELVRQRNITRQKRFVEEQTQLRPLPVMPLAPCRELRVSVSRFSTVQILRNTYSLPSRLIGTTMTVRVRAETIECYVGSQLTATLPRLQGRQHSSINYRHVIRSLVRKPGAFAAYRYREEMFPNLVFRQAYDQLVKHLPQKADVEYLRILYLAATNSESDVETALVLLAESGRGLTFERVRELVQTAPLKPEVNLLQMPPVDLSQYDQLLPSRASSAQFVGANWAEGKAMTND